MTSVGSVDPCNAGDGCDQVDLGEDSAFAALFASPAGEDDSDGGEATTGPQTELLIGFLADFHAAGREPPPAPSEPAGTGPLPSRFAAFAPPDPGLLDDGLGAPNEPLPVWPPMPAASAPVPEPAAAPAPTAAPTPEPPKQSRFGRLSRRR